MSNLVTNDDYEIDLDLFEKDVDMDKTKMLAKISKKSEPA